MIISFDIMNENDYKKIFIDPPISTVHGSFACFGILTSLLILLTLIALLALTVMLLLTV